MGTNLPNSVTSIEPCAFQNCTSLTSVTIGNGVTEIGKWAFLGCDSLTAINVATGNASYSSQDGVLYNKNKTTIIEYPPGKTGSTFTIPDNVISIREGAFLYRTKLTSITIPSSVTSIEESAFGNCENLNSVTFQGMITSSNLAMSFDGDLRDKYLARGIGTYTRPNNGYTSWTKQ